MEEETKAIQLAGCIITDDYNRMLLLHHYRSAGFWQLPSGLLDEEELPEEAAKRSTEGQLGVPITLSAFLGKANYEHEDEQYEVHWFKATTAGQPQAADTTQFDDIDFFEFEDLPSLSLSVDMLVLEEKIMAGEIDY